MIGQIIVDAHHGFQRAARAITDWWTAAEDHPAYKAIRSRRAYDCFQADIRAKREAARGKHGRTAEIDRLQRQTILAALASAANRNHGAYSHD